VQAKLQVELAQLKYTLPRLKRMWTHLERFEGGIGMRGPGETQLETDKRLIQRRIRMLQAKLDDIERRRQVTLLKQPDEFVVALVGYTNAGKSTLLNRLTGSEELVEDKLFATLDTRTRRWRVDGKRHVLLKDTVGFIRQLPHHLVASFHATLAETQSADVLLHVVDASSSEAERHIAAVEGVLRRIDCDDKPTWLVLNKWDRVPADRRAEALRLETHARVGGPVFAVSAVDGSGLDAVRQAVVEQIEARQQRVSVLLPHGRGDLFAFCQRHGKVLAQELREDGIRLELELGPAGAAKLRSLYPEGFAEPSEAQHEPGPDDEKKGEA
jgi:GTP-binding protein HflX